MNQKYVVFDMDGVIFDTETLYKKIWQSNSQKLGYPIDDTLWGTMIGVKNEECEEKLCENFGSTFPLENFRRMCTADFEAAIEEGLTYKSGFEALMAFLKLNGYTVTLATSSSLADVKRNFSDRPELNMFEFILTGDDVKKGKPDPAIYQIAAKRLQANPGEVFVIEDSRNGMRAAIGAGCKAIMVLDAVPPDEWIRKNAFCILHSLDEVLQEVFCST